MIGEIRKILTSFYDLTQNKMCYKNRPALIIAQIDSSDYVYLPISSITKKQNLDPYYDVEIDPTIYPLSGLNKVSYIRTHKQQFVNRSQISTFIGDFKTNYEEAYLLTIAKMEEFQKNIVTQAIQ